MAISLKHVLERMKKGYQIIHTPAAIPLSFAGSGSAKFILPELHGTLQEKKDFEEMKKAEEEGIDIGGGTLFSPLRTAERKSAARVSMVYNLIPREGPAIAYANIAWDSPTQQLVYTVVEPQLDAEDLRIMDVVRKDLEVRLDVDFGRIGSVKAKDFLQQELQLSMDAVVRLDKRARLLTPMKK